MKRFALFCQVAILAIALQSCETDSNQDNDGGALPYTLRVLTFEDGDYRGSATNASTYWSDFIPQESQYGSGNASYDWHDEGNTELAYYRVEGTFGYFAGQAGVSNYVGSDYANEGNYLYDLQAYNVEGGHSGTNFNVHYGYVDDSGMSVSAEMVYFEFADGIARVIDNMWVTNTTYVYSVLMQGDSAFGGSYTLSDSSTFKIVAYGYRTHEDTEPTTTEFYLLNEGREFVTEWTKWDLSVLGSVVKVAFNLVGSDDMYGNYGLCVPGYFAYDDVAVRFDN